MVFPAKNPLVFGIGYAAARDIISYVHHSNDSENPVAGHVTKTFSFVASQSGAFLWTGIHLGFNEDENGLKVLDGAGLNKEKSSSFLKKRTKKLFVFMPSLTSAKFSFRSIGFSRTSNEPYS